MEDRTPITWHSPKAAVYINGLKAPYLDDAGYPYQPKFFGSNVNLILPWRYRLLMLLSGRVAIKTTLQCEHVVHNLRSTSHAYVMWPLWIVKLLLFWEEMKQKLGFAK